MFTLMKGQGPHCILGNPSRAAEMRSIACAFLASERMGAEIALSGGAKARVVSCEITRMEMGEDDSPDPDLSLPVCGCFREEVVIHYREGAWDAIERDGSFAGRLCVEGLPESADGEDVDPADLNLDAAVVWSPEAGG